MLIVYLFTFYPAFNSTGMSMLCLVINYVLCDLFRADFGWIEGDINFCDQPDICDISVLL